jgi:hypothetical protein
MSTEHILRRDHIVIFLRLNEDDGSFSVACSPEPDEIERAQFAAGGRAENLKDPGAAIK